MFDYRGSGRSSGVPTIAALKADALQVFDQVNARYPGRVVLHGQSLGSFVAAYVAQQRPAARGMVLESTTTNVRDWGNVRTRLLRVYRPAGGNQTYLMSKMLIGRGSGTWV
jgi:pimeloyl-ACP methyl ester carboxylesterase